MLATVLPVFVYSILSVGCGTQAIGAKTRFGLVNCYFNCVNSHNNTVPVLHELKYLPDGNSPPYAGKVSGGPENLSADPENF